MIEKNNVSPSISSLKKVLSGIPMSLLEFFDTGEDLCASITVIYRGDDIQLIEAESGIEWCLISKHFPNRKMAFMVETYPPGSDTGDE